MADILENGNGGDENAGNNDEKDIEGEGLIDLRNIIHSMFSFCHLCQPVGTSNIGSCHQLTLANIWFSSLLIFGVPAARHYQIFGFQQIFGVLMG